MASLDFYALEDDIRDLVHFILDETDARIFESYSRYDEELREFHSFEELAEGFQLGYDPHGGGHAVLLQLWSASVMRDMGLERIALKIAGHSFRWRISGVGLIQLYFGGRGDGFITDSHYGHWSEAGARQRADGDVDEVDWRALSKISGRLQRQIRNKMGVAKLRSRPILRGAFQAVQAGWGLRYSTLEFHSDSQEISVLRRTPV